MSKFVTEAELDISNFVNPLNEIIKQQKEFGKVVAESAKASKDSFQGAAQATQQFNDALKKGTGEYAAASSKRQQLYQEELRNLLQLQVASKKAHSVEDIQKYGSQIEETKKRIALLQAQEGKGLGIIGQLIQRERELLAARERSNNPVAIDRFNAKIEETRKKLADITGEGQKTGGLFSSIFGQIASAATAFFALDKIVGAFSSAKNAARDFEKEISKLSSITGASGKDLEFYRSEAEKLGEAFKLPAKDIAQAFTLIGSAKPELLKSKEALAAVTQEAITLSKASGDDLPTAAQSLIGVLNQFQLPATDAARVINALAAGAKEGAAEIPQAAQAIDQFGVAAASANVSVEESVALVQTLAEFNIKGAESGTALRNVLSKLSAAEALPKEALDELERFGVDLKILADNSLPIADRLKELSKIQGDATAITKVFGLENKIAGEILINNVDKFRSLTTAVTGTNVAIEQAKINTDNLAGDEAALGAATDSLALSFGQWLSKGLRPTIQGLTTFVLALKAAPQFIRENKDVIAALLIALISFNGANIAAAASTLAYAAAERVRAIATRASAVAQGLLNAVMTANPIGLVIAAVAVLAVGFKRLYESSETVRAGIAGLGAVAKEVFTIIKESVASFISGFDKLKAGNIKGALKDFGDGIVKSNPIGIAIGEGKRLGDAFNKGFNDKLKSDKSVKEVDVTAKVGVIKFKPGVFTAEVETKETEEEKKKRLKLLDDLNKDLLDLQKKYDAARLSLLDKNSEEYLSILRDQQLEEIRIIGETIKKKELLAGKDGILDPKQVEQLAVLEGVVYRDYFDGIVKLAADRNERIFNLQAASDAKEIEAVERKYRKLAGDAKGNAEELVSIEKAKQAELEDLVTTQKINKITTQENKTINSIQNQANTTGIDSAAFEKAQQVAILEAQKQSAREQLLVLAKLNSDKANTTKAALAEQLVTIQSAITKLNEKNKDFSIWGLFGLDPANQKDQQVIGQLKQDLSIIVNELSNYANQQVALSQQVVDQKTAEIDEKNKQLDREIELNRLGFASNVEGKRKEVEQLKAERAKALADQRKALQLQQAIDTASQATAIITASANILKGFSLLPLVGQVLGIAAVASMVGFFIATKAKAASISKREGGLLVGPSHERGGIRGTGSFSDIEVEGDEFVVKKKSTRKHRELVEAINEDDFSKISTTNRSIRQIIEQSNIVVDERVPKRMTKIRTTMQVAESRRDTALLTDISTKLNNLERIAKHTSNISDVTVVQLDEGVLYITKHGKKLVKKKQ